MHTFDDLAVFLAMRALRWEHDPTYRTQLVQETRRTT